MFVTVLISLLMLCTVQSSAQPYDNEIMLSNSAYFIKTISISNDTIKLNGISADRNYSYIMLRLIDVNGKEVYKKVNARSGSGDCSFLVKGITNSSYKVCIYHGPQEFGSYSGDLFGNDLSLVLSSDGDYIDIPQAMPWNEEYVDNIDISGALKPEKDIESGNGEIAALASSITAGCSTDYAKVKAVHDWVCSNIYYDYDVYNKVSNNRKISALDVLHAKRACCDGFSNLTAALLRASGIPAKPILGYTFTKEFNSNDIKNNHEWVRAFVDGRWITVDTTWDTENRWENGRFIPAEGEVVKYKYFDSSTALFSVDHAYNLNQSYLKGINKSMALYVGNPKMWDGTKWTSIDDSGTAPVIKNGRTLVPIRKIVESLGGTVSWDAATRTVTCIKDGISVSMVIGSKTVYCNGTASQMDVSPEIINGRTMIPVRFLVETLDCNVQWYPATEAWNGKIEIQ